LNSKWNTFIERGIEDEQIRTLANVLYNFREKIFEKIDTIRKDNFKIFDKEQNSFTSQFEMFLQNFFNNNYDLNKSNYELKIYEKAYNNFKKSFYNYLNKRLNEKLICEIIFENGYSLYMLFEALEKINKKIIFRINHNEIEAYVTNESKICLMRVLFKVKNFQFYYFRPIEISINLNNLTTLLKCRKNDKIETHLIFKEDGLNLYLYSKINKSKINRTLKEIEENLEDDGILEELLELEHSGFFEIDESKVNYLISQSGRFSKTIKLTLSKKFIKFSEENSIGTGDIVWKRELIPNLEVESKKISVYFSIEYFKILTNFMFGLNPMIQIFLEKVIPIKMRIDFKSLEETYGLLFIAQRELF